MTREQERLFKKFIQLNKSAHSAGEPYLMEPEEKLRKLCAAVPDDKAKDFLTAYKSRELQKEQKAEDRAADNSDVIATSPFEMYLWQLYMMCGGKLLISEKESWILFYSIMRELIEQDTAFLIMPQSRATNAFSKLFKDAILIDLTGTAEAVVGTGENSIRYVISEYGTLPKELSTTTHMLLDFLMYESWKHGRALYLEIPIREYALARGRSMSRDSIKELIKEVSKDLTLLKRIEYLCQEKVHGKWEHRGAVSICGGVAECPNGLIKWSFSIRFLPTLYIMAPLDYPKEILKQNPKTSGYYLLRYVAENYRINGNRDISVKTLLEIAPTIPKIEEVKKKRMSATQKIIKPFFTTLDNINSLYYDFISAEGKTIPVEDVTKYDVFESGKIRIDYNDYPEHEEREKAKQNRKKKIAKAKEKAMQKALEKKAEQEIGLQ